MAVRCALMLLVTGVQLVTAGCSSAPTDDSPTGALRLFLEAMERSEWDDSALEDAYRLLSPEARADLQERAQSARALSGRETEPWEMIAQGRFHYRFAPRQGAIWRERIEGNDATVTVQGSRESDRARVPMVREGNAWRVVLRLPE